MGNMMGGALMGNMMGGALMGTNGAPLRARTQPTWAKRMCTTGPAPPHSPTAMPPRNLNAPLPTAQPFLTAPGPVLCASGHGPGGKAQQPSFVPVGRRPTYVDVPHFSTTSELLSRLSTTSQFTSSALWLHASLGCGKLLCLPIKAPLTSLNLELLDCSN